MSHRHVQYGGDGDLGWHLGVHPQVARQDHRRGEYLNEAMAEMFVWGDVRLTLRDAALQIANF